MALDELYRQVILDHYRNPRHRGEIENPDGHAEGVNPLCGDEVEVDLRIADGVVSDVSVRGQGCSISQSSASMMGDAILGKTLEQIGSLAERFHQMMSATDGDDLDLELGDLSALQGVRKFPVRIKCAGLPWATLEQALSSANGG